MSKETIGCAGLGDCLYLITMHWQLDAVYCSVVVVMVPSVNNLSLSHLQHKQ